MNDDTVMRKTPQRIFTKTFRLPWHKGPRQMASAHQAGQDL
jgi:hypothetical protein